MVRPVALLAEPRCARCPIRTRRSATPGPCSRRSTGWVRSGLPRCWPASAPARGARGRIRGRWCRSPGRHAAARAGARNRAGAAAIAEPLAAAIADAAGTAERTLTRVRGLGLRVSDRRGAGAIPAAWLRSAMPPHVLFVHGDARALAHRACRGRRRHAARRRSTGRTIAGRIAAALDRRRARRSCRVSRSASTGPRTRRTLRAGGTTVAVIGGGHAVVSPRAHGRLGAAIVAGGGAVVSELAPDVEPTHGTFPRRNRIISGLTRGHGRGRGSGAERRPHHRVVGVGTGSRSASWSRVRSMRRHRPAAWHSCANSSIARTSSRASRSSSPTSGWRRPRRAALTRRLRPPPFRASGGQRHPSPVDVVRGRVTVDEIVAAAELPVATVLAALAMLEAEASSVGVHGRFRPAGTLLGAPATPRPR